MKMIYLPMNFSKGQEFRAEYEQVLNNWKEAREKYKMTFKDLAKNYGFSRATYYRKRKILNELDAGRMPISRAPRAPNLRRWGDAQIGLMLRVRRKNPTYGKAKIAVILKRFKHFQAWERKSKTLVAQICVLEAQMPRNFYNIF